MFNGLSFITGHKALVDEAGELEQLLGIKSGATDHAAKILQHEPPEFVAVDAEQIVLFPRDLAYKLDNLGTMHMRDRQLPSNFKSAGMRIAFISRNEKRRLTDSDRRIENSLPVDGSLSKLWAKYFGLRLRVST
jgi:hypothetical protein